MTVFHIPPFFCIKSTERTDFYDEMGNGGYDNCGGNFCDFKWAHERGFRGIFKRVYLCGGACNILDWYNLPVERGNAGSAEIGDNRKAGTGIFAFVGQAFQCNT